MSGHISDELHERRGLSNVPWVYACKARRQAVDQDLLLHAHSSAVGGTYRGLQVSFTVGACWHSHWVLQPVMWQQTSNKIR